MTEYQNPTPVVVGLVPVWRSGFCGLLTIRRGIAPGVGKLALPGGFLEIEPWQQGLSREVWEETGVHIPRHVWRCFDAASSEPNPNRVMIYGESEPIHHEKIPTFTVNNEVQQIGILYRAEDMEDEFAFPLHYHRARRWLISNTHNEFKESVAPKGFEMLPMYG